MIGLYSKRDPRNTPPTPMPDTFPADIPRVVGTLRDDGVAEFWCVHCKKLHLHGGFGKRAAHCYKRRRTFYLEYVITREDGTI